MDEQAQTGIVSKDRRGMKGRELRAWKELEGKRSGRIIQERNPYIVA